MLRIVISGDEISNDAGYGSPEAFLPSLTRPGEAIVKVVSLAACAAVPVLRD
jgi:hypothetical protein